MNVTQVIDDLEYTNRMHGGAGWCCTIIPENYLVHMVARLRLVEGDGIIRGEDIKIKINTVKSKLPFAVIDYEGGVEYWCCEPERIKRFVDTVVEATDYVVEFTDYEAVDEIIKTRDKIQGVGDSE